MKAVNAARLPRHPLDSGRACQYIVAVASIRAVRRAEPFDSQLVTRHPLLWPLARAAQPFAAAHEWPAVDAWNAAFAAGAAPVEFVRARPRPRGGARRRRTPSTMYDVSIIERGLVPSREHHWHDFFNALVWGTFPRAKVALHRRQAAMLTARLDAGAPRLLPPHRTREQDGLAMIDEGGVLALTTPSTALHLVFGHAVYEGFVLGVPAMTARMVRLPVPEIAAAADPIALIAQADAALADALADATFSTLPDDLPRVFVPDTPLAQWMPPP